MQSSCYRRNFGVDSVEEIKKNVNSHHEKFLREDDPDKKADELRYMCAYAMQYLYLVPHDKKFIFKETERVLHQSAMNINEFDPREASVAFEHLAIYAQNIYDQPWRRDFHTLKLTSGFYVHNVAAQLSNAHEILVAMGYVHVEENKLQIMPKLDEKRIINISRDMIVASQECLILSQIWQRVADQEPDYPLTTGEVFEFRKKYLGDTDKICKTLLGDIRRRNYEDKMQRITKSTTGKNYVPVDRLIDFEVDSNSTGSDVRDGRRIKEVDIVEKVLQNTRLLHDKRPEEEHTYDQVYVERGGGISNGTNYQQQYPHHGASAFVPTNSSRFVNPSSFSSTFNRESVNSPLIPKTVSSFNTTVDKGHPSFYDYQTLMGSSSSLSSASNRASRHSYSHSTGNGNTTNTNQPLKFSKVAPEEMGWDKRNPPHGSTINWSEWSEGGNSQQPHRRRHSERAPDPSANSEGGRSRKPIMPNDVYPDDHFPAARVIKPTPIHSSHAPNVYTNTNGNTTSNSRSFPHEESGEDDMMNEALAYHSQVAGTGTQKFVNVKDVGKSGWDTTSISSGMSLPRFSDEPDKRSPSTESSPWDGPGAEGTIQKSKGVKDTTNSRPRLSTSNKPASSSSSSSSHRSLPVPESNAKSPQEEKPLPNLDSLYYQQLLHKPPPETEKLAEFGTHKKSTALQSPTSTAIDSNLNPILHKSKPSDVQEQVNNLSKITPWSCIHCTFKNKKSERICEMCAKSKDFVEEEEEEVFEAPVAATPPPPPPPLPKLYSQPSPTSSDMLECQQCTLLNSRTRFECEACGYRLRNANSPKSFVT